MARKVNMFRTEVGSTCQTTQVRTELTEVVLTVLIIAGNIARTNQDNTELAAQEGTFLTTEESTGPQHFPTFTWLDQMEAKVSYFVDCKVR